MFTLSAVPVKFVGLLVLFTFTTILEAWRVLRAANGIERTSHGFHLAMSVIMLLMVPKSVWVPFRNVVPVPVSIFLMVLGALWFAYRAVLARPGHRAHPAGCALMFTAMVWHLAAMMVKMHNMAGMQHGTTQMGGMNHGSMQPQMAGGGHGALWWMAVIGLPLMAWLLWASAQALRVAFITPSRRLSSMGDFAMNFGMFWMSTGLLVPVLPFFSHLAF